MPSLEEEQSTQPFPSTADRVKGPDAGPDQSALEQPVNGHRDPLGAVALLGLGLLLEGSSLVVHQATAPVLAADVPPISEQETGEAAETRRALVGLVVEARARAQRRRETARQARRDFFHGLTRAARPLTHWLPVEVALTATEILADYGQRTLEQTRDRLVRQGQNEEAQARALAQRAILGWMDDALTYGTHNPEVRKLVTQQGEELATSALDDFRTRSESIDSWLAQATRKALKRTGRAQSPAPTDNAGASTTPQPQISLSESGA